MANVISLCIFYVSQVWESLICSSSAAEAAMCKKCEICSCENQQTHRLTIVFQLKNVRKELRSDTSKNILQTVRGSLIGGEPLIETEVSRMLHRCQVCYLLASRIPSDGE